MAAPSLIEALKSDPRAQPYLKTACAENGVGATISAQIAEDDIVILGPDLYYNSALGPKPAPPSTDCLVVVRCHDGTYSVHVIELKNIGSPKSFSRKNLREKFLTCTGDFMMGFLQAHFGRQDITLAPLNLYFVADPYGSTRNPESARINKSFERTLELSLNPIRYDGYPVAIRLVHPDPMIQPC